MKINVLEILKMVVEREASDLHIKAGKPPVMRVKKMLVDMEMPVLSEEDTQDIALSLMSEQQRDIFKKKNEVDFAYCLKDVGRFRANIFRQRGQVGIVMRLIKTKLPSFEELSLPPIFEKISLYERGIVLITGASSSGKSTTLAAMIDYINIRKRVHVMTIEDPIEYLHEDKMGIINQREVSLDTESFKEALRHVIRQDPDIILIGEMRDAETFYAALSASETGHLVFSTLHSVDTTQVILRILDFFPATQHDQIRMQMALNLRATTCQRLIRGTSGKEVVPAVEVLIVNPTAAKIIRSNKMERIQSTIQSNTEVGMQTFNQSLAGLVKKKLITLEEALSKSSNPEALKMNLKGIYLDENRSILGE
ncbi:MAG: PilT/PilU family type 4a pilus ATPase [Candidatus Omnitrophota bacterium]